MQLWVEVTNLKTDLITERSDKSVGTFASEHLVPSVRSLLMMSRRSLARSAVQYNIRCHGELDEPPLLEYLFIDERSHSLFL